MSRVTRIGLAVIVAIIATVITWRLIPRKDGVASSPDDLFSDNRPTKPTVLITIGLSGSGKSTWSRAATKYGWVHLDIDDFTAKALDDARARNEVVPELGMIPDKTIEGHFFALRKRGHRAAYARADALFAERKSFIWDGVNLDAMREEITKRARAANFDVWWLVFVAEDWRRNRHNLFVRESQGGLASFVSLPVAERCAQLDAMLTRQVKLLKALVRQARREPALGPDRMLRAHVIDQRGQHAVADPCP